MWPGRRRARCRTCAGVQMAVEALQGSTAVQPCWPKHQFQEADSGQARCKWRAPGDEHVDGVVFPGGDDEHRHHRHCCPRQRLQSQGNGADVGTCLTWRMAPPPSSYWTWVVLTPSGHDPTGPDGVLSEDVPAVAQLVLMNRQNRASVRTLMGASVPYSL